LRLYRGFFPLITGSPVSALYYCIYTGNFSLVKFGHTHLIASENSQSWQIQRLILQLFCEEVPHILTLGLLTKAMAGSGPCNFKVLTGV